MLNLKTREIEPTIKIINKIIILLIILNFIIDDTIVISIFISGILGIYELYIYNKNKEFIKLLNFNKYDFYYNFVIQYYKIGLLIILVSNIKVIMLSLAALVMENSLFTVVTSVTYDIPIGTSVMLFIVFLGISEIIILNRNTFKVLLKYFVVMLFWYIFLLTISMRIFNYTSYIFIFTSIINIQLLYLFIMSNFILISDKKLFNQNHINYEVVSSILFITVYQIFTSHFLSMSLYGFIISSLLLCVLLVLNILIRKKYRIKATKQNRILKIYAIFSVLALPILKFSVALENGYIENVYEIIYIIICIVILTILNILIILMYNNRKFIFSDSMINKYKKLYDFFH